MENAHILTRECCRCDDWWRLPCRELAAVQQIGLPGAAENIACRLVFMVSIATAAELGAKGLATQACVLQLMVGVMMFGIATGLEVEVVVGWLLGVVLGWGLPAVWVTYAAEEWIRGPIVWRRGQTLDRVPHARASCRRLRPVIVVEG